MKNMVVFQKLPLPQAQPCLQMKTLALSPNAVLTKGKGRRFLQQNGTEQSSTSDED